MPDTKNVTIEKNPLSVFSPQSEININGDLNEIDAEVLEDFFVDDDEE
ncbi:hypothetical protein [Pseudoalteromonas phenolica]|uniref:Uncharacterized protein n=1 Tax=Pseudoalteromonas phenolica TaxID=161398 RepID=A0A0S2K2H2_9GAMM|nr:hypothetical protein [Pseudoalteromonas phenolica]ALO42523.1 hypothetical protein PP2015_2025 [Pseudoalteromonas phenolica]MBE0356375.1 hypothetical protein [Pseudoalteromonas phenolica O-BC30]